MNKEKMIALAQGQLDAYNQRDIDTFCSFYHPRVEVFRLSNNEKICEGIESFRALYQSRFEENPELHCELRSRVVLNESILDEEWVTGAGPSPSHVVAIYHFSDDLIRRVNFTR